jgi:hypothetical protein
MSSRTAEVGPGHVVQRHLGVWAMQPGGPDASLALVAALGIRTGDRIVDLAPGTGDAGLEATEANVYSWTAVYGASEEAGLAMEMVPSEVTCAQVGSPDATGLPSESATVVVSEGLLFTLPPESREAVVSEAVRLLRPNGRIGIHELCIRNVGLSDDATSGIRGTLAEPANGALFPLTEAGWRALLSAAGLEVESIEHLPLDLPGRRDVLRRFGPRRGMGVWRRAHQDPAGSRAQKLLAAQRGRFSGVVIVARRPYIGALRGAADVA